MSISNIPNSLCALYISKENIGVAHYDKPECRISCGLIQSYVSTSKHKLNQLITDLNVKAILTNNNKHPFLAEHS